MAKTPRKASKPANKPPKNAPRPFVIRAKKAKRALFLADPAKIKEPLTTRDPAEAYTYIKRRGGLKMLERHPRLRKIFRVVKAA